MKKVRRQVAAHGSLHSLEKTMARFLPAGLLQELGEMPGRRVRWLPMTLIFWVFLQMVLCPGTSCREAQRATQAWWRRQGRRWLNPNTNAFCLAPWHLAARRCACRRPGLLVLRQYNLIRRLMLESSLLLGTPIERQSFKGTVDTLRAWRETLAAPGHASQREDVLLDMLLLCALDQLPHRPGRHQPRAVKRRPKPYQLLTSEVPAINIAPAGGEGLPGGLCQRRVAAFRHSVFPPFSLFIISHVGPI